ncbi:MAG: hypothetical protein EA397_02710 [Deltaproteobacteria bacterium]|nr:MAG: hypothetical protein EA397_02710 [Deltaproteobacteria bacterium]
MRSVLISASLLFSFAACNDTGFTAAGPDALLNRQASITGRVCHPSGSRWLSDALVYANVFREVDGVRKVVDTVQAFTDRDGYYTLSDLAPNTEYLVYTQYRNQVIDQQVHFVRTGEDLVVPEPSCFDPEAMNIAVIVGAYDDMERMLDSMGFLNYTIIDGSDADELRAFLSDGANLEPYDVLFFNGGIIEEGIIYNTSDPSDPTPPLVHQVLGDYVWEGGSLVASDWSYDVVEQVWPDAIDFLGDDNVPNAAQLGEYGTVNAVVTDDSVADFIGQSSLTIEYDLPVWPPIVNVEDYVSVHMRGNVSYREGTQSQQLEDSPLMVSFSGGRGRVAFATFRVAANQSQPMQATFQYIMYNVTR